VSEPKKGVRSRLARLRPRSLGLQARITMAFALGALLLSVLLAGTTFALTRANLANQRENAVCAFRRPPGVKANQ